MIDLDLMKGHNHKREFNLRKQENVSIVEKRVIEEGTVGIGIRNKLKTKMKKMIMKRIL